VSGAQSAWMLAFGLSLAAAGALGPVLRAQEPQVSAADDAYHVEPLRGDLPLPLRDPIHGPALLTCS
jgi:hypothetical protein